MVGNYIVLNNKKYELDETLSAIIKDAIKSPFTQVEGQTYYYMSGGGNIFSDIDYNTDASRLLHKVANYCTNKSLLEQRALHETLNRLLWRFSEMYGGDIGWNGENDHFYIVYNKINNEYLVSDCAYMKTQGVIYFPSMKRAQEAIETVVKPFVAEHPDFVW